MTPATTNVRPPRTRLPGLADRLPLGASGLAVSPFCLGVVNDPRTVGAAFDAGINFFFVTADLHWPIYDGLRRGLADLLAGGAIRDRIVVAACSYVAQPEFLRAPFHELVDAVPGLERIDVLIAGGAYGHELAGRWPVYVEGRRAGFLGARAIGASFHDRQAAVGRVARGELDIAYLRHNARHPGASSEVFPHLPDDRQALLYTFKNAEFQIRPEHVARLGLDDSYWIPTVPDLYRFGLAHPQVDGCLVALTEVEHVAALADALAEGPLSPDEEHHLRWLIHAIHAREAP
jgi:hypothetical protein